MTTVFLPKTPTFDIAQTLECGQVFRYTKLDDGYRVLAKNHIAIIKEDKDNYIIECDDPSFFVGYFDMDNDYARIQACVDEPGFLHEAIEYGKGIHILRQDPVETLFSFIISQNNHIPRIKGIIERICEALGEDMGGYHAFPTIEALASAGEDFYKSIGAGYRSTYLDRVAKSLIGIDINEWACLDTNALRDKLLALHGVGRKVADCVLLFGFNKFDVFPVDTWIKKIYEQEFGCEIAIQLSVLLVEKYKNYSGFVQQWAFYYKREKKV